MRSPGLILPRWPLGQPYRRHHAHPLPLTAQQVPGFVFKPKLHHVHRCAHQCSPRTLTTTCGALSDVRVGQVRSPPPAQCGMDGAGVAAYASLDPRAVHLLALRCRRCLVAAFRHVSQPAPCSHLATAQMKGAAVWCLTPHVTVLPREPPSGFAVFRPPWTCAGNVSCDGTPCRGLLQSDSAPSAHSVHEKCPEGAGRYKTRPNAVFPDYAPEEVRTGK